MKTLRIRSWFHSALLLAVVPAFAAGCSSASASASGDEAIDQQSSALTTGGPLGQSPCASIAAPRGRACNTVVCQGDAWAYKPVPQGTACRLATGQAGVCVGETLGTCESITQGVLFPKYSILSVQYAPPGKGSTITPPSTVDYGTGTTFETTTTNSSSFTSALNVTVSANSSALGWVSGGVSVTGGATNQSTSTNSLDFKMTTQTDFTIDADSDVVDHGLDRIYLWLNPEVNVTIVGTNQVSWSLGVPAGQNPLVMYVTPTWLLNGTTPSDVKSALAAAGITQADYAQILGVDPFATNASATIDTTRFVYQTELPYEPVTVAGQQPSSSKYALSQTTTGSATQDSKVSYSVDFTVSASANFLGLFDGGLKVDDQLTWTNDNTSTIAKGTAASATATIAQPGFDYNGPIYLDVYLDTVYQTFLFVLPPSSPPVARLGGGVVGSVGAAL